MADRKPEGVKVPRSELESHLCDQLSFFVGYATAYDNGEHAAAKQMAHALRLLLHEGKNSKSLLRQLDLKRTKFLNAVEPYDPANLVSSCGLIAFHFEGPSGRRPWMIPRGDPANLPTKSQLEFSDWWNMPVLVAKKRKGEIRFCRRDIVLHQADQDGGSHVDDKLPRDYAELSRWNAIGIVTRRDGVGEPIPIGNPIFPCVRQIAHETLKTLQGVVPSSFRKPYALPESFGPSPDNPPTGVPTAWTLEFGRV